MDNIGGKILDIKEADADRGIQTETRSGQDDGQGDVPQRSGPFVADVHPVGDDWDVSEQEAHQQHTCKAAEGVRGSHADTVAMATSRCFGLAPETERLGRTGGRHISKKTPNSAVSNYIKNMLRQQNRRKKSLQKMRLYVGI